MYGGLKKKLCDKCNREISKNNFNRHFASCDGTYFVGPHKPTNKSKEEIRSIQLEHLARIRSIKRTKPVWNKDKTKESDPRIAQYASKLKDNYATGITSVRGCAVWSTEQRSNAAKAQSLGGYRPNAGHSKKYKVKDSFGNEVTLQSSYELLCSEILDRLDIKWVRPRSLKYDEKRYFPDFYLPEYDLYLDPKNDYLAKKDKQKITCVCEQNNVKVIVLTQDLLNEDYIRNLVA